MVSKECSSINLIPGPGGHPKSYASDSFPQTDHFIQTRWPEEVVSFFFFFKIFIYYYF